MKILLFNFANKDSTNQLAMEKDNYIDGLVPLIEELGVDKFVRLVMSNCYFFSKDLVRNRHDKIVNKYISQEAIPGRYSTSRKHYGKKISRKKQEVLFRDKTCGEILTEIDGNGNSTIDSLLWELTGYSLKRNGKRQRDFVNYTISHIWGNAIHPFFFSNLWNIVLVPSFANNILDKPSSNNGEYNLGSKLLNTLKAIIYEYNHLSSLSWDEINLKCPGYNSVDVVSGKYEINVLLPRIDEEKQMPGKVKLYLK